MGTRSRRCSNADPADESDIGADWDRALTVAFVLTRTRTDESIVWPLKAERRSAVVSIGAGVDAKLPRPALSHGAGATVLFGALATLFGPAVPIEGADLPEWTGVLESDARIRAGASIGAASVWVCFGFHPDVGLYRTGIAGAAEQRATGGSDDEKNTKSNRGAHSNS